MKAFAVILVVCLAQGLQALDKTEHGSLNDFIKTCLAENDLDTGLVTELWKDHPKLNGPQKNINCFLACMYQKLGALHLHPNGTIIMFETSPEETLINWSPQLREQCTKQAGNDICELAACLDEHEPNGLLS